MIGAVMMALLVGLVVGLCLGGMLGYLMVLRERKERATTRLQEHTDWALKLADQWEEEVDNMTLTVTEKRERELLQRCAQELKRHVRQ